MNKRSAANPTPTPDTSMEDQLPTEEPTEAMADISSFKVKVLNGTAVAGLAAKLQTDLEGAGFTVSDTGNAANKNFTAVEIQSKTSVPKEVITKLKEQLTKSSYTVGTEKALDDGDEDDIIVIIGTSSKPTEATAKATPTPTEEASATEEPTPSPTKTP